MFEPQFAADAPAGIPADSPPADFGVAGPLEMFSPTFRERRGGAFEVKFLLDDAVADEVLRLARESMTPDPHGDSGRHDGYVVNSLYFDTPQFDTPQFGAMDFGTASAVKL